MAIHLTLGAFSTRLYLRHSFVSDDASNDILGEEEEGLAQVHSQGWWVSLTFPISADYMVTVFFTPCSGEPVDGIIVWLQHLFKDVQFCKISMIV